MKMSCKLTIELTRLLTGQKSDPELSVSITECFEFSGLTRRAWCETLNISDSLWSQYRTGRVKVPDKLQKEAVNLALLGAAVRLHAAKITRKKDL